MMIFSLLKNSKWGYLLDFVSPRFFDVMPSKALVAQVKELTKNSIKKKEFEKIRQQQVLLFDFPNTTFVTSLPKKPNPLTLAQLNPSQKKQFGHLILKMYFTQLLCGEAIVLDLRPASFLVVPSSQKQEILWKPSALWSLWDQDFLQNVRDLYTGFYTEQLVLFDQALEKLNLFCAKDIFLKHFGENQRQLTFQLKDFITTFHSVFLRCQQNQVSLHGNFICLGIYLATLYESLELLGQAFDVRACFENIWQENS